MCHTGINCILIAVIMLAIVYLQISSQKPCTGCIKKWLAGIPLQDFFSTKDILCSDHFEPNCFRWDKNRLRLKALVVPTIFKPTLLAGKSNKYCTVLIFFRKTKMKNFHFYCKYYSLLLM